MASFKALFSFQIPALLLSASLECHGDGIPHSLVVPNDFLTQDPYEGVPHLDAPISISDDVNDIHASSPIDKIDIVGVAHHDIHPPFKLKKKPLHSTAFHHAAHGHLPPPVHLVADGHSHKPHVPNVSHTKLHRPHATVASHHTFHTSHTTHSSILGHSTHLAHTSASHLVPQHPPPPVFKRLHVGHDPYLYTHPLSDKAAYFPEHGYNVLEKLGSGIEHEEVHFSGDHYFPTLGYNLDPYFRDFPVFGYFDFSPKFQEHHRRRRGTAEPSSFSQNQNLVNDYNSKLKRTERQIPGLFPSLVLDVPGPIPGRFSNTPTSFSGPVLSQFRDTQLSPIPNQVLPPVSNLDQIGDPKLRPIPDRVPSVVSSPNLNQISSQPLFRPSPVVSAPNLNQLSSQPLFRPSPVVSAPSLNQISSQPFFRPNPVVSAPNLNQISSQPFFNPSLVDSTKFPKRESARPIAHLEDHPKMPHLPSVRMKGEKSDFFS
ncbi:hypothetical protein SK128_021771 [Halocaridina rubra]|uniref:Uncharacterized protein n=1 Tax=Halocaridina rubra TaxID=373956 RepID=A0AAN8WPQ0_HALRR